MHIQNEIPFSSKSFSHNGVLNKMNYNFIKNLCLYLFSNEHQLPKKGEIRRQALKKLNDKDIGIVNKINKLINFLKIFNCDS